MYHNFIIYFDLFVSLSGCEDINNCKCKVVSKDVGEPTKIVLGQDKVLNVTFVLSNTGDEPAIGIVLRFSLMMNLEFIDEDKFHCKKEIMSHGGRISSETDVSTNYF